MFTAGEQALDGHPNLKTVKILDHPPRYDTKHRDPLGLKPQLVNYANMIYRQLWLSSLFKDKIQVTQSLLHVFNPVVNQPSKVPNQISEDDHVNYPQALYQKQKKTTFSNYYSIPVNNKCTVFWETE